VSFILLALWGPDHCVCCCFWHPSSKYAEFFLPNMVSIADGEESCKRTHSSGERIQYICK